MKKPVRTAKKESNEPILAVLQIHELERVTGGVISGVPMTVTAEGK